MISPNGYEISGYEAPATRRVVSKSLRGTGQKENVFQVATSGYQVVTRHRSQGELFLNSGETTATKLFVFKWIRDTGHRTSGFQMVMRHRSQDERFPSDYAALAKGRHRSKCFGRHASQDELLPKAYEAPVRTRVISKLTRGTGHTTIGFQVATRHRSQGKWLPNGNNVRVTVRMVSEWRRDTRNIFVLNGYETPVTGRVVSKFV